MHRNIIGSALFTVLSLQFAGCGGAEDSEVAEQTVGVQSQALGGQLGPVSEEPSINSMTCARQFPNTTGLVASHDARCSGSYCDSMYFQCNPLPAGVQLDNTPPSTPLSQPAQWWSGYVSEEGGGPAAVCSQGGRWGVIDGIQATGRYSDNISVHCQSVKFDPGTEWSCQWTSWISEESFGNREFGSGPFGEAIVNAVRCSGSYCDYLSFWACVRTR